MDALFAYISANPAGPFICMGLIAAAVLGVKAVLKPKRNEDIRSIGMNGDGADDAPCEDDCGSRPAQ